MNRLETVFDVVKLPLTLTCRSGILLYISLHSGFKSNVPWSFLGWSRRSYCSFAFRTGCGNI